MIEPGEGDKWAGLYGCMFPTADEAWIRGMCTRMIRTLGFNGPTHEMEKAEYRTRLEQLWNAVNALPPDVNNHLMKEGTQ